MLRAFAAGEQAHALRLRLDAIGYTAEGVEAVVGSYGLQALVRDQPWAARWASRGASELETAIRLFTLSLPVPVDEATRAIGAVADWQQAGLIAIDGGDVHATLVLRPHTSGDGESWLVASDIVGAGLAPDVVMGVGGSSQTLAHMTVRAPVASALDLGTGCGIQALHAAQHAAEVLATDRNPRALAISRLNTGLNAVSNVRTAEGDLFAPAGTEYDLIVSNPPFVVSPESTYLFRDGGGDGDGLCRQIVREAPARLRPGGFCQLLASWALGREGSWEDQLGGWFDGNPCDVWVLQRVVQDPAEYATEWLGQGDTALRPNRYDDWMRWYEEQGIAGIGFGLITLRRPLGTPRPHRLLQDIRHEVEVPAGAHVAAQFDRLDLLAGLPDEDLLRMSMRLAEGVELEQRSTGGVDSWALAGLRLSQTRGLRWSGEVHPRTATMLAGCDGVRPLGDVVAGASVPATEVPAALAALRELFSEGFLRV